MLLGGEVDHPLAPTFADELKFVYPQRGAMLETFEGFWAARFFASGGRVAVPPRQSRRRRVCMHLQIGCWRCNYTR